MNQLCSIRRLALGIALAAAFTATVFAATAQARLATRSRIHAATGALITLRKTALGTVLADSRGRTLYLFEKDRNGVSACNTACQVYWPALTSRGTPHAGMGVHQSPLRLGTPRNGTRQVIYAGHPLYMFVGDKRLGQTTGEGLSNFGAPWYVLAASGTKVEQSVGSSSSSSSAGW